MLKYLFKTEMIFKQNFVLLFGAIMCFGKVTEVLCGATEEQMVAAAKLMRDVCLPKFPKVTNEMADDIRRGNLPNEKDPKCYVYCILEIMQTMKKGKFVYEASLKQVDILLPDRFRDEYKAGLAKCKDASNGIKNNCDAAYAMFTCLTAEIKSFVFP